MRGDFQRLITMAGPEAMSLNQQAARGTHHPPHRSQFSLLVRHFLARFFNTETASADGDAKGRLAIIAVATGLPGFAVMLYLWPIYHPIAGWPPGAPSDGSPPAYWLTVNHHFFFVIYSFVALGIATVFQWDLLFPNLLDVYILVPLPIPSQRLFRARIAAIALLLAGFLIDANMLAPFVLPAIFDPPNLTRMLGGHLLAVLLSGLYSAALLLAVQGVLVAALGEALFRRIALAAQGLAIAILLMLLLLFPVLSAAVPVLLQSNNPVIQWLPPFWFLGIYQRVAEGPAALPVFAHLARIGLIALAATLGVAAIAYPIAYVRRVRQLVAGAGSRDTRTLLRAPGNGLLHAFLRIPGQRAVFHFMAQTLGRVPRYRIYLVLYGGVGLAVVAATVVRLTVAGQHVHMALSADGVRSAVGIAAFWTIAGLRMAYVSPGNQQGSWVFRIVNGRPPQMATALGQSRATRLFTLLAAGAVTLAITAVLRAIAPPELRTSLDSIALFVIAAGSVLLLTDAFFLTMSIVPFTGETAREEPNLALTVLKYFTFFPFVAAAPIAAEPWIAAGVPHLLITLAGIGAAHLLMQRAHRRILKEHCDLAALEDDEPDFPMKLGLRY